MRQLRGSALRRAEQGPGCQACLHCTRCASARRETAEGGKGRGRRQCSPFSRLASRGPTPSPPPLPQPLSLTLPHPPCTRPFPASRTLRVGSARARLEPGYTSRLYSPLGSLAQPCPPPPRWFALVPPLARPAQPAARTAQLRAAPRRVQRQPPAPVSRSQPRPERGRVESAPPAPPAPLRLVG